jgi:hypothetical protein
MMVVLFEYITIEQLMHKAPILEIFNRSMDIGILIFDVILDHLVLPLVDSLTTYASIIEHSQTLRLLLSTMLPNNLFLFFLLLCFQVSLSLIHSQKSKSSLWHFFARNDFLRQMKLYFRNEMRHQRCIS